MTCLQEVILCGLPISKGIGIGISVVVAASEELAPEVFLSRHEVEVEILRYRKALLSSKEDLEKLKTRSLEEGAEEIGSILASHLTMIQDPLMTNEIEEKIRAQQCNTESIFYHLIRDYKLRFSSLQDTYFQERVRDIIDVSRRILGYLHPLGQLSIRDLPAGSVVFSHELIPSNAVEADPSVIAGFISTVGGVTSHAAIIARAKGIPYVANIDLPDLPIQSVIVDGIDGLVILNPSKQTIKKYEKIQKERKLALEKNYEHMKLNGETMDGYEIKVFANIENAQAVKFLKKQNTAGVGLFRSEYLFLSRGKFPSEKGQFEIYKQMAQDLGELPLTLRLFDLGGDKKAQGPLDHADAQYFAPLELEQNPVLGCRAIRFLFRYPELLKTQLRAILRALPYGNVQILIPMVSDLEEIKLIKKYIQEVQKQLKQEGVKIYKRPLLGCMLEVPASVIMVDVLAKHVDFFSIGTNDLLQYVLAMDRGSSYVSDLSFSPHPSILRMSRMIVASATAWNRPVILCGECASDPLLIPVFIGLGIRAFSVAICHVPLVKQIVRQWRILEANRLAESALEITSSQELRRFLEKHWKAKNSQEAIDTRSSLPDFESI